MGGTLAWIGGTMTGPGSTMIGPLSQEDLGGALEAYGDLVLDGRDLTINGYAVWHSGTIDVRNGATITLGFMADSYGEMTIQGEVVNDGELIVRSGSVLNVETLVNNGTIIVQSGGVLNVDSLTDNGTIIYE